MRDASPSMHTSQCLPCRPQPTLCVRLAAAPACLPAAHRVFSLSAIRIYCSSRLSLFFRHGPHILHCIACASHCTLSVRLCKLLMAPCTRGHLAHAWRAGCACIWSWHKAGQQACSPSMGWSSSGTSCMRGSPCCRGGASMRMSSGCSISSPCWLQTCRSSPPNLYTVHAS